MERETVEGKEVEEKTNSKRDKEKKQREVIRRNRNRDTQHRKKWGVTGKGSFL